MDRPKASVAEMLGEFAREFALLLLVFVPLDVLFKDEREPYFWIGIAVTLVICAILFTGGVWIERRRQE
jgi:drug/metabolite transporter (DMT)-like permease